jgi:signal transduction histidine kinase/CheY-like chemotaxis protein
MKKRKNLNFLYVWLIVLLIMIAMVVSTVNFYQTLQVQLFAERQSHLIEMTAKITEVIDVTIETMQQKADSAKLLMEQSNVSQANVTNTLESLSEMLCLDNGILIAMDDQGRYYSSEGKKGRWSEMEDLVSEDNVPVIRDIAVFGEKQSCMVFFARLNETIPLGDDMGELEQMAVAIPLETIREHLTISMFGNQCFTYLINPQGRRLYKQTFSNTFIEDYNVISAMKADEFIMGGDVEDLIESVKNRETLCLEFREAQSGENYFVSTVPVSGSDWTVLLFVPTDVLGVQTNEFMNTVILYFVRIALAGFMVFAFLIYVITTNRNDKKMIAQQKENNRLLAIAAEEAKNANAAKSEFLAHMSHDIRTPINGILGMTHIALNNKEDIKRVDDCLHKINGAAEHLLTLVNDVLDMSSIESGKTVISHEPLDIRRLINNCTSIIDGQLVSRNLNFIKNIDELQHPFVYGDELHLRQVFINILGNAIKFTPDGGSIEFRAKETQAENGKVKYHFEFEDTGIGISEEFQKKIFDEFSQENDNGRSTYRGTGLGMAISKKFVESMGGTIAVRSRQGEGSCFTVEIVFDIDEEYKEKTSCDKKVELNGLKVLLVEDNELNMEIAREILDEEGMQVTSAENGAIAVEKFENSAPEEFDVILMDVMMPVMNGYDATRAIRKCGHPAAKTIPIIAMTANAYREDVEKAMDAGMNAHIAKPIDTNLLMEALDRFCGCAEE